MQIPRFARSLRVAMLAALLLVLAGPAVGQAAISPYTLALIVKPPTAPAPTPTPPPGGSPIPAGVPSPEPASIVSGLLGSGLAGLFSWLRKRRKLREEEAIRE